MRRPSLAIVLLCSLVSARAADEPAVERPQLKQGDRWTYRYVRGGPKVKNPFSRVYELVVTFVNDKAVQSVQTLRGGRQIDTTWTPEWNLVNDMRSGSYIPDSGTFRFPLRPGTSYTSTYEVLRPKADTTDAKQTLEVKVVRWEQITVAAGTFRALRIEASGTSQRLDRRQRYPGSLHYVYWYVPQVKRWAKMTMEGLDGRGFPASHESEELIFYGSE